MHRDLPPPRLALRHHDRERADAAGVRARRDLSGAGRGRLGQGGGVGRMLDERVRAVLARLEAEDAAERERGLPRGRAVAAGRAHDRPVPLRLRGAADGVRGARDRRLARLLDDLARRRRPALRRTGRLARARPAKFEAWDGTSRRPGSTSGRSSSRATRSRRCPHRGRLRRRLPRRREGRLRGALPSGARQGSSPAASSSPTTCSRTRTPSARTRPPRQADPTLESVTVPLDRGLELSVVLRIAIFRVPRKGGGPVVTDSSTGSGGTSG